MKKHISFFVILLIISSILILPVFSSEQNPPPPRALPEGAKMRISDGDNRQLVADFAFSLDGSQIAVISPIIGIWIYDAHTGAELALLTGHTDLVTSVMFSPDGKTLASGSFDKTVRLWDAHTFQHRATLIGHKGNTKVLAFSPDSKKLATGASAVVHSERRDRFHYVELPENETKTEKLTDGTVRVWDVLTGKPLKSILITNTEWVTGLAYMPDNINLRSVSTDGIYRTLNTETGQTKKFDLKDTYRSINFSPDSTRFVAQDGFKTVLFDAVTENELATLESEQNGFNASVTFSQNSDTLICRVNESPKIRIWNARTGQLNTTIQIGNNPYFVPTALSPNGRTLAIQKDRGKGPVQLLDTKTGNKVLHLTVNTHVYSLRFSPDGQTLAMQSSRGSYEGVIRLWDVHAGVERDLISFTNRLGRSGQPAFVASGRDGILACGIGNTKIWLFDGNTGKYRANLKGHTASINDIAFTTDGEMLASASIDGTIRLWNPQTTQHLDTFEEKVDPGDRVPQVYTVVFSPDGQTLASVSGIRNVSRPKVQFWDVNTSKHKRILKGDPNDVSAIAFSPDKTTLASSGSGGDSSIRLWDVRTGKLKATYIGHSSIVTALAFSPDGTLLASGGGYDDAIVQLWDIATGENSPTLSEHFREVSSLAFSPDGKLLASGGYNKIEVWDVQFRQHIATLNGHRQRISSLTFTGDGNTLASASYDQTVVLWKPIPTVNSKVIIRITPSSVVSPVVGRHLTFNVEIAGGENVAGYHLTMQFDATALRFISSNNDDYLPGKPFFMKPIAEKSQVTLASTAITDTGNGDGTLATLSFEVIDVKPSTMNIVNVTLSDRDGKRMRPTVKSGKVEIK